MIKKRSRPQPRVREPSPEEDEQGVVEEGDEKMPLADLLELRKLRKSRQGIDVAKLNKGDMKKKRKRPAEDVDPGGLKKGYVEDEDDDEEREAKARRAVRSSNFTQQTNALDVDKHMMAYIEDNLKIRSRPREAEENKPIDPQEALYDLAGHLKVSQQKTTAEEGNVSNSISMLTAIPEVDLGMDARLKNIADTEKAKRVVAEERHEPQQTNNDEAHLAANRFYRPNLKSKSDADVMRDAKLQAMGLSPSGSKPAKRNDKPQMATDEMVMERFKKHMRK
ncbi:hepatocellular carcinoma-associated antigen 59-domain-containing protein [Mucidula mucida]|nr:hepatocellular carcinoma-associated antigen 59-domain-containing protein [Mucidula mucida]